MSEFVCDKCNYITFKKSLYIKHTTSLKHAKNCILINVQSKKKEDGNAVINNIYITQPAVSNAKEPCNRQKPFVCECGKEYAYRQNLYRHHATCFVYIQAVQDDMDEENQPEPLPKKEEANKPQITPELILQLIAENQELKQMLANQYNEYMEKIEKQNEKLEKKLEKNNELLERHREEYMANQSQIVEYCKQPKRSFNLNMFLNVQCKDAINLSDFARELEIKMAETEQLGKVGYVNGITQIVMNRMADLGVNKRPIHCTDVKRETLYVKDEDKWDKDNENKKIKDLIERVAMKNYKTLSILLKSPTYMLDDDFDKKMHLTYQVNGGCSSNEERERNNEKILRMLSKELLLDKLETDIEEKTNGMITANITEEEG